MNKLKQLWSRAWTVYWKAVEDVLSYSDILKNTLGVGLTISDKCRFIISFPKVISYNSVGNMIKYQSHTFYNNINVLNEAC